MKGRVFRAASIVSVAAVLVFSSCFNDGSDVSNTSPTDPGASDRLIPISEPIGVLIDIKPGACPNRVRRAAYRTPHKKKSPGITTTHVTVAVVGTESFDVKYIDVASLRLQGSAPDQVAYRDASSPAEPDGCPCDKARTDGIVDLVLRFEIGPPASGSTLYLMGSLLDGTPIAGSDCVKWVGPRGPGKKKN